MLVTTTTISEEVRPTGQCMRVLGMEQEILDNLTSSASAVTEAPVEDVGCGVPAEDVGGYEGHGQQKWWQRQPEE